MHVSAGSSTVTLVLLGLFALFLVLRLRSILGKRTGLERPAAPPPGVVRRSGPVVEARAEPVQKDVPPTLPDPSGPVGLTLARIRERDRSFDPAEFLRGAEGAFRRIVKAFAEGDRTTLRDKLTADAYAAFDAAIAAREAEGQTQRSEIKSLQQVQIVEATLNEEGGAWRAAIDVRFVSDQISVLFGRDGQPVSGADAVTELADLWTFERLLGVAGVPGWRLASARSA